MLNKDLQEFSALSLKPVLSEQEQRRFKYFQKTLATGAVNPTQKFDDLEERTREVVAKYEQSFAQYVSGKLSEERFKAMIDAGEFRVADQQFGGWGRPVGPLSFVGGNLQGGTGSGVAGGFTVPPGFFKTFINSTKQFSELLNADNVRLVVENSYGMPGRVFCGFDFSSFLATKPAYPGDAVQIGNTQDGSGINAPASVPAAYAQMLSSQVYAITLRIDNVLDQDSMVGHDGGMLGALAEGFGEGFGRKVGTDLAVGSGTPLGIATGATYSGITAALSYNTLENIYFSVNRAYRNSPKCAWLMNDSTYQSVRKLTDGNGRPLIDTDSEFEKLFGKKLLVSPDLPYYNASPLVGPGQVVFGDFSHYLVRCSQMWVQRNVERFVDFGEVALLARMRVDAIVFDPSNGVTAPIQKSIING